MYSEDSIILGLLAVLGFLIFFFIIIGIIFYVLNAIGLFKIAKKMGKEDLAFMAWIPVANSFLVPILVENDVHEEIRGKFTLIFAISFIASIILGLVFYAVQLHIFNCVFVRFLFSRNKVFQKRCGTHGHWCRHIGSVHGHFLLYVPQPRTNSRHLI